MVWWFHYSVAQKGLLSYKIFDKYDTFEVLVLYMCNYIHEKIEVKNGDYDQAKQACQEHFENKVREHLIEVK